MIRKSLNPSKKEDVEDANKFENFEALLIDLYADILLIFLY